MKRPYKPEDYGDYLGECMEKAYDAFENGGNYTTWKINITDELKVQWKCGTITRDEADDIKDFFWRRIYDD